MTTEQIKEQRDWLDGLTGYTPGPWRYRPQQYDDWGYVRGAAEEDGWMPFICQAKDVRATEDDENAARKNKTDPWVANARLIAAAPDLHTQLTAALDEIERLRDALETISHVGARSKFTKEVANCARAALKGERR